ncbi:hypothetical protein Nmel_015966 [Mimus melanotis]
MISGGRCGLVMAAAAKEERDVDKDNDVDVAATEDRVRAWAAVQAARGRRVALVTSGGTQVPLEARAVRFLENFSSGRRGAASAEQLVRAGYSVCFLHRARSVFPWARALPPHGPALLDALRLTPGPPPGVAAAPAALPALLPALREYQRATEAGALLAIEFTGLVEYLALLRAAARALAPLGSSVMFYLSAAVSDFYIPVSEMPEHKIQSSEGPLQVRCPWAFGHGPLCHPPQPSSPCFQGPSPENWLWIKPGKTAKQQLVCVVRGNRRVRSHRDRTLWKS